MRRRTKENKKKTGIKMKKSHFRKRRGRRKSGTSRKQIGRVKRGREKT